jgi:predicted site-specific integrase-resolvase
MLFRIGDVARLLGVTVGTLRRWHNAGRLVPRHRTAGGHRRYDAADINPETCVTERPKRTLCYARVSSHDQKDDLQRQISRLERYCAEQGFESVETISDLGSGLNYAKRGLKRLLSLICRRQIDRLVVENKDRLLRFGSDIVFDICRLFGIEVIVVEDEPQSFENRLATDVIELMVVFSARLYGARSHRSRVVMN